MRLKRPPLRIFTIAANVLKLSVTLQKLIEIPVRSDKSACHQQWLEMHVLVIWRRWSSFSVYLNIMLISIWSAKEALIAITVTVTCSLPTSVCSGNDGVYTYRQPVPFFSPSCTLRAQTGVFARTIFAVHQEPSRLVWWRKTASVWSAMNKFQYFVKRIKRDNEAYAERKRFEEKSSENFCPSSCFTCLTPEPAKTEETSGIPVSQSFNSWNDNNENVNFNSYEIRLKFRACQRLVGDVSVLRCWGTAESLGDSYVLLFETVFIKRNGKMGNHRNATTNFSCSLHLFLILEGCQILRVLAGSARGVPIFRTLVAGKRSLPTSVLMIVSGTNGIPRMFAIKFGEQIVVPRRTQKENEGIVNFGLCSFFPGYQ